MIYKLERRGTGLAMSASLYNFLNHNKIEYSYNFELGGIEITEEAMESIRINFKHDLEQETIKHTPEIKKAVKTQTTQNTALKRRSLF
jgi:hypothetical protein